MEGYILALNCGSSSAKFNLFKEEPGSRLTPFLQGIAEEIGNTAESRLKYTAQGEKHEIKQGISSHREALLLIFDALRSFNIEPSMINAVGHRVVHGGSLYKSSVRIDRKVMDTIRELIPIAPLHNPPNLVGIEEAVRLLPDVPQVAVFDTAFHGTIPEFAYRYAVPDAWYEDYGVRRYGFHGTSHMYVAKRAARLLGIPFRRFNGITAHLGNGCSITKVQDGRSVDTSMGFTPLEGLVMGTRSGDIDSAIIPHVAKQLCENSGMDEAAAFKRVMHVLNKESGLKAMAGTNMMQEIRQKAVNGDPEAETAISIYAYRAAKYIGSYWATLPSCDAIVFTAGLGENEGYVRKKILGLLGNLKIDVDDGKNGVRKQEVVIGKGISGISVMVVPTDEEIVIGYDALYLGHLDRELPEIYPFEY